MIVSSFLSRYMDQSDFPPFSVRAALLERCQPLLPGYLQLLNVSLALACEFREVPISFLGMSVITSLLIPSDRFCHGHFVSICCIFTGCGVYEDGSDSNTDSFDSIHARMP